MADYSETKEQLKMKMSETEKDLLKMIKKMSAAKEKLEKEISDLSLEGEPRAELAKLYATIPGVSKYLAAVSSYFLKQNMMMIASSGLPTPDWMCRSNRAENGTAVAS